MAAEHECKHEKQSKSIVRAVRVLAWRCPDCDLMQFSERSSTHIGECHRCAAIVTVDVKADQCSSH